MRSTKKIKITVCICTFRRPLLLKNLLEKLTLQEGNDSFSFSIVIVDNDSHQTARKVVNDFQKNSPIQVNYYCEPRQNISLARNLAVRKAKEDFIAFIDDDELPHNRWLDNLITAYNKFKADGIQGPVYPVFNSVPPKWIIKGQFYERPIYKTGMTLKWKQGRTGNLFFKKKMIQDIQCPFDPRLGSGGEDQEFFRTMINRGCIFKYCSEAIVYEHLPLTCCTRLFLLKRALLRGKMAVSSPKFSSFSIIKSIIAIVCYSSFLPVIFVIAHEYFMKYLVKMFDHLGKILHYFDMNVIKEKYITK